MATQTKTQADASPFLDLGWFKQASDLMTQPQHLQSAMWRESMQAAAGITQLHADWLKKISAVNNPMDVVALTSEHFQSLFRAVIDENTRIATAIAPTAYKK